MKLRHVLLILVAPTCAVALFVGGALAERLTTHPVVRVATVPEVPQSALYFVTEFQSAYALNRSGLSLRALKVNAVTRAGRFYIVNLTATPARGWAFQFRGKLDAKTLELVSLTPFNASA